MDAAFVTPWGLVGLIALPLIWWLQKRLRRPPDVELPSLMFLLDEEDARALPRGRLVDAELLLALAAAALLAFAAAEPVLESPAPRAVVRVAVSGGSAAARTGVMEDVKRVLADIRAQIDRDDVLDVTWVGGMPATDAPVTRPTPDALLAVAQAGVASRRVVLSDVSAPSTSRGATWIARGREAPTNTGIAAVRVVPGPSLFVTLVHQGPSDAIGRVVVRGDGREVSMAFRLPRDGYASYTLDAGLPASAQLVVSLAQANGDDWQDELEADDRVVLERGPLRITLDPSLAPALAERIRAGLTAVLGPGGFETTARGAVRFGGRPGADEALHIAFAATAPDAPVAWAPEGALRTSGEPLVRDLSGTLGRLAYPVDATTAPEGADVLLARIADGRVWPILTRAGRSVRLAPDPLRGAPPLVDTPFWPLWLENVVAAADHGSVGEGWRARGLLDAGSSRTGTRQDDLAQARLDTLVPALAGSRRSLRPPLILGALLCLGLLWAAPRLRRRVARRAKAHTGASAGAVAAR